MNKRFLIIIFSLMGFTALTQTVELEKVRFLYFEEWVNKCGAEELVSYLEEISIVDDPLIKSYKGAALATTANCVALPWNKLKKFNEGKQYIETAIQEEPSNLEIRFIRFSIQTNIPGILNYDNLKEDKDFILKKLNLQSSLELDKKMIVRICNYLLESDELSTEEKKTIGILIAKK